MNTLFLEVNKVFVYYGNIRIKKRQSFLNKFKFQNSLTEERKGHLDATLSVSMLLIPIL